MDTLLDHLAAWKPFTAVVVGDFMLDQVLSGEAERLSADAPVPVLHVRREESTPGGAANLCLDLAAMKGRVRAVGVVGADTEGRVLRDALVARGVEGAGLIADASRPTTVKRNLVGLAQARHPQKMFRLDVESREPLSPGMIAQALAAFDAALHGADVVCIEDYNKGVCTPELCHEVIARSRAAGVPVLVDPASLDDYSKYAHATAITPNRTEAERATGLRAHDGGDAEHNAELARRLLHTLQLDAVVLTLDRHGALLLGPADASGHARPVALPTVARAVYDVTGAGDMFLAGLAAARANGVDWPDAVRFANAAAGLEVEIFGVAPIPLEKIHAELLAQRRRGVGQMEPDHPGHADGLGPLPLEHVRVEVSAVRAAGRKVVFTNGCFDVLHAGHVSLLQRAAALGDYLVVGINSDASVRALKGPDRPVNNQHDRARVLSALRAVDAVVVFDDPTPLRLVEALRPDVLVKGGEYRGTSVPGADVVLAHGGRVELLDMLPGRSTTAVIRSIRGASSASSAASGATSSAAPATPTGAGGR